ncbi:site-specific integrase [Thermophilibacter mediterraneus]|uniref:site-specific integrase n=1 Tax=Thermophilibacter mediterraneus TaxID=1871031 RepID=UPI003D189304
MDKPLSFHAFETLYWCGVREGELLALKPRRFDFRRKTLTVAESYQRIDGQDVLTDPKTPKSKRVIAMPGFYAEEMEAFLSGLGLDPDERIFPVTEYFLSHEMVRGCKAAGLEPIRVHDLRHSHVSLLIDMGFTALAIADRSATRPSSSTTKGRSTRSRARTLRPRGRGSSTRGRRGCCSAPSSAPPP